MLYTSSEAAKLLRKLNEEREALEANENQSSVFRASLGEDIESVRPSYDYAQVQKDIELLEAKIRTVKHAINKFNTEQDVHGFNMTIDQMLVYIPQLTRKKNKLFNMQNKLSKQRAALSVNVVDYLYANYDIDLARADYIKISDELGRAQTALDLVNSTVKFEIDI